MNALQQWKRCPEFIEISDEARSIRLHKRGDRYAIRGNLPEVRSGEVEARLPEEHICILSGAPPTEPTPGSDFLPVYAAAESTPPAVATERVFLRLREDLRIDAVRDSIESLGFDIDLIPAYALNCAWLEPRSGRIEEALSKLERLRAIPGTTQVEPQLLRPIHWRARP